jgi:putative FmdB family regulatory protein
MPIYEYRCKACGERFEKLVRISAKSETVECPKCGKHQAEKAVSLLGAVGKAALSSNARSSEASCGPSS